MKYPFLFNSRLIHILYRAGIFIRSLIIYYWSHKSIKFEHIIE